MNVALVPSILLTGFVAMASQIVLARELLTVFYGNELSMAFILAGWLVSGAAGSALLGRLAGRMGLKEPSFSFCQLALSMLLPLSVVLIRSIKPSLGVNPGEAIPLFPMITASLITLAPSCVTLGFLFALSCRLYGVPISRGAGAAGKVYSLEAAGAMAGGLVTSFALIKFMSPMQIMAALGMITALSAALVAFFSKEYRGRFRVMAASAAAVSVCLWASVSGSWNGLDMLLTRMQWPDRELVSSENSIYGSISVVRSGSQFSFFGNGLHLYTVPDARASEESAHFALLEHPAPETVLIVGGGPGIVEEAAKHPLKRIDYVELDPLMVKTALDILPPEYTAAFSDGRVSVKFGDARRLIRDSPGGYDVIILSLGDPYTAQLNRFYTSEFFKEARDALRPGGVLSFGLGSSESYIGDDLARFLGSVYATLKEAFADVKVLPGDTAYFVSSAQGGATTSDYRVLMDRASSRGVDMKYVREYYLFSRFSSRSIAQTESALAPEPGSAARINTDFRPISYYYDIVFWTARFKGSLFGRIMKGATEKNLWAAAVCVLAALSIWGIAGAFLRRPLSEAALAAVVANGFSQMALQVVIILSFQILYGYLFYRLGLILTMFMAGLASGGWCGTILARNPAARGRVLVAAECALFAYSLALMPLFRALGGAGQLSAARPGEGLVFFILPIVSGFTGALIFPAANAVCMESGDDVQRRQGLPTGPIFPVRASGRWPPGRFSYLWRGYRQRAGS